MRKGKTKDATSPFVVWKKGVKIEGEVTRIFVTDNGPCCEVSLQKPITINGASEKKVSFNATKAGIRMAAQAAGLEPDESGNPFQVGDKLILTAVGTTPTTKGNPRQDFELAIDADR